MKMVVQRNITDMYAEPDPSSERVSQALFGERACVRGRQAGFVEVETDDGYAGWMRSTALHDDAAFGEGATVAMVTSLHARVWSGDDHLPLTLLPLGARVPVVDEDDAQVSIRMPGGSRGRMKRDDIAGAPVGAGLTIGEQAVAWGLTMVGVPYLWGGRSAFGVDCSGLTQMAYLLLDQVLPRDAYLQAESSALHEVPRGAVSAGDLLFFAGDDDVRGRGITHVGLAIGDGRMVHAQGGGVGVTITSVREEPFCRTFRTARRISPTSP